MKVIHTGEPLRFEWVSLVDMKVYARRFFPVGVHY